MTEPTIRDDVATCSYSEFRPDMGLPVRISLGYPQFPLRYEISKTAKLWELTPRKDYLRAPLAVYNEKFHAQLERYGPQLIEDKFLWLKQEHGASRVVLLCFEKLSNPKNVEGCHRRDFAAWWLEKTGEVIPELGSMPDTPPEPPEELPF